MSLDSSHHFAVIMAAGKGTRIGAVDRPKALFEVGGKPMLGYVIDAAKQVPIAKPIIVIGHHAEQVKQAFPDEMFVLQSEQKGTAHAVMMAEPLLRDQSGVTLILSADHPFITPQTLRNLIHAVEDGATIAVLSADLPEPEHDGLSRIVLNDNGSIAKIVEKKDANDAERAISLRNLGTYAVNNEWLWPALKKINASPVTGEYYLTAIFEQASSEGRKIASVPVVDMREGLGINTPEHLQTAEKKLIL